MTIRDVMPVVAEHGGHDRAMAFEPVAAPTYRLGEWVTLAVGTGLIDESAAGTAVVNPGIHFVAANDSTANIARIGDPRYVNPPNTARLDSVYHLSPETEFATGNVYNNNDTNIGPAGDGTMVGVLPGVAAGLRVTVAGVHGIDINSTGLNITRTVDAFGVDVGLSGAAAARVYFKRA